MPADIGKSVNLPSVDQERLAQSGIELSMANRCGSYLQMNQDVMHATCSEEGIEVLPYKLLMPDNYRGIILHVS
jgi:D-alanine-D-alanine ligase-like ATP-grasp enzyme